MFSVQGLTLERFFVPLFVAMEMVTVMDECDGSVVIVVRFQSYITCTVYILYQFINIIGALLILKPIDMLRIWITNQKYEMHIITP